jgi:hypothetical protein
MGLHLAEKIAFHATLELELEKSGAPPTVRTASEHYRDAKNEPSSHFCCHFRRKTDLNNLKP